MQLDGLTLPAYASCPEYELTYGPAVVELCELAGFIPDPEQRLALDWIFAVDENGLPAAFEFAIVACRQNIKTGLFKMAALGWLFITDEQLIVWSAHEFDTAAEAHRDLCELIKGCPALDAQVAHYYYGNGSESIELHTGARLIFKARTKGGGRGLSGDKVVLDEAFALQPTHMGALAPLTRTRARPQLVYGSSAPKSDAEVLHALQKRGRAGTSARLAYLEWSAPEGGCAELQCDHRQDRQGCALDNRDNWRKANTALGRRITYESMQSERDLLPVAEFMRELLGWAETPDDTNPDPIFGEGMWEACGVPAGESSADTRRCFSIAVTIDRKSSCIGYAGETRWTNTDGEEVTGTHVEPIKHASGTGWVAKEAKRLQVERGFPFIIDGKGPAAPLIPELDALDVEYIVATTDDVLDGWAMLFDRVQAGLIHHMTYPELETAVSGAVKRFIGDRWAIGRKASQFDVCPLEAIQLAAWGSLSGHGSDYNLMSSFH